MPSRKKTKQKAGIVAHRLEAGGLTEVLLVSARQFPDSWVFPVGTVKKGEPLEAAARRECAEESGYTVEVSAQLPQLETAQGETKVRFTFFLATVTGTQPNWEKDRDRRWVALSDLVTSLPDVFRTVGQAAVDHLQQPRSDAGKKM